MSNIYKNGKIYKVIGGEKEYYGSTTRKLNTRWAEHKYQYNEFKQKRRTHTTIYDIFDEVGIDNCIIELVEDYPCENKKELLERETYYIQNNACVNKYKPYVTEKQKKEYVNKYNTEYYKKNKTKLLKKYFKKILCDC